MARVIGTSPSDIYGTLSANGRVFLINQNGILFAPGSQVNVGGLVASTLNITDAQFLNGQYDFLGASGFGSVNNQGTININGPGGYAALLGSTVMNNAGFITATSGTVALASGNEITVNLDPTGTISAVLVTRGLDANPSGSQAAISNSGKISADGGTVILTVKALKGLFRDLINNSQIIEANSISTLGGKVVMSADGDQITNTGRITAAKVQAQTVNGDFNNQGAIAAENTISVTADGNINLPNGSLVVSAPVGGKHYLGW